MFVNVCDLDTFRINACVQKLVLSGLNKEENKLIKMHNDVQDAYLF